MKEKINFKERLELGVQSSMLLWYPKLTKLPIPQVKTEIIETGHDVLSNCIRKDCDLPDTIWKSLHDAMDKIRNYPMFMRTDQASAKHSWKDTCFLPSKKDLKQHLYSLLEEHEMQNMAGELGYDAIVFREFLELESSFTTDFYGDFPVNKELRCFIDNGKLVSIHNYWFEDAVEQGHPHDLKWREKLKQLNNISKKDLQEIKEQLSEVNKVFKEYWSVDFAKSKEGIWYLIDMARGEVSYHPENIVVKVGSK